MLFHSLQFLLFLPLVFALYWWFPPLLGRFAQRSRQVLLLLASCVFYMAWNPAPVLLIFYLATSDWLLGRAIEDATKEKGNWLFQLQSLLTLAAATPVVIFAESFIVKGSVVVFLVVYAVIVLSASFTRSESKRKKRIITMSVVNNLSLLAMFKYAAWITSIVVDVAASFNVTLVYKPLGLLLPVGLSFVVFQCMSYTIDVYRGSMPARKSWLEVTLFISFFPQIVAGPIVRAADFLPQLDKAPELSEHDGVRALSRIALGMFKKLVIADLLAANLVNRVFETSGNYSGLEVVAATFAYTAQIYYDFSAYSDIAIGCASLFGFTLRENFDKPYLSKNLFEFWRRWHQSLGRWLFDYLYVPLGGSKCSKPRTCWNLYVTMILGGIWHGANFGMIGWGAVHGLVLIANRILWWTFGKPSEDRPFYIDVITGFFTFLVVMEARIVFKAETMAKSWEVFSAQFNTSLQTPNLTPMVLGVMVLATIGHLLPHRAFDGFVRFMVKTPVIFRALLLLALVLTIKEVADFEVQPFIYFQF
ncbi:MAG: MBOAT family protein [Deltaproteobacteria bacterium]|nr:MBOAT family protein [Deltaproteobacteria bacterium]